MTDQIPSFGEFPQPTYDDWYNATVQSLKGASFEKKLTTKTYEDIIVRPLYRKEDTEDITPPLPGKYPYIRGHTIRPAPWLIAQEIPYGLPEAFNEALVHDLANGQTAINLVLDRASQLGLDPDKAEPDQVGRDGVSISHVDDLVAIFNRIDLTKTPLFVRVGENALPFLALFRAYLKQKNIPENAVNVVLEADPIGTLAYYGEASLSYDDMAKAITSLPPNFAAITIHSAPYHDAGASATQELACAMATGVAYLRAMQERDLDINQVATSMRFVLAVGTDFFTEIAKLRAARMLWAQVVRAFNGSNDAQQMRLIVRSANSNKTVADPYVNMLRTTIEAMAGAIGGAEAMHIAPFDSTIRPPDEFSRRIARNQQLILQNESHFKRIVDPAGGSWYVEYLTNQLAEKAWGLFQEIEQQGGIIAILKNGWIQEQMVAIAAQRTANLAQRKDHMIGVNIHPNLTEDKLNDSTDYDAVYAQLVEKTKQRGTPSQQGHRTNVVKVSPLTFYRQAAAFESLRSIEKHPRIFLANMGTLAQHKARTDFTVGFFEVGGFEIINPPGFESNKAAIKAAIQSDADVVVICSDDDLYREVVPLLASELKTAKPELHIILAGYPTNDIATYQQAGVNEFIHIRSNCYKVNLNLQHTLGVTS